MAGERPEWIPNDVWTPLLKHWNSPSYRNKCETEKKIGLLKQVGPYIYVAPLPLTSMPFGWHTHFYYSHFTYIFKV